MSLLHCLFYLHCGSVIAHKLSDKQASWRKGARERFDRSSAGQESRTLMFDYSSCLHSHNWAMFQLFRRKLHYASERLVVNRNVQYILDLINANLFQEIKQKHTAQGYVEPWDTAEFRNVIGWWQSLLSHAYCPDLCFCPEFPAFVFR